MKLVLFVEGHTEHKVIPAFLKRWLDVRLKAPIAIQAVRFDGWAEMVDELSRKAEMYLTGPGHEEVIAVVSLLDLFGPTFFPAAHSTVAQRESWGRKHLQDKVNHPRFRHFFAVHELEAWLLSQPAIFPPEVQKLLPTRVATPERINFSEPPSYLLDRLYSSAKGKSYKKVVDGSQLFARLNPEEAYAKCPYFRQFLDELLNLADAASGQQD